jgi:hypothetical protein
MFRYLELFTLVTVSQPHFPCCSCNKCLTHQILQPYFGFRVVSLRQKCMYRTSNEYFYFRSYLMKDAYNVEKNST